MFKIYSPDNYFSLFGKYPAIFVEDSGLMYSQKEYTALLRNPIGKIDLPPAIFTAATVSPLRQDPSARSVGRTAGIILSMATIISVSVLFRNFISATDASIRGRNTAIFCR
ncbi:MAG: hypothetical protein IJE98_02500 [Oscillospiraceae bacterium]|nr:hypothetical protein [Oscillospiraceae bacterium]